MFKILLFAILPFLVYSQYKMKIVSGPYSIEIFQGWTAEYTKSEQLFILYAPRTKYDQFQENCNLTIETISQNVTVDFYIKKCQEQLKTIYHDFVLVDKNANCHVIKGVVKNMKLQQMQYFYKKGANTMLILTFTSDWVNFDKYKDTFQQIAKSFKYK